MKKKALDKVLNRANVGAHMTQQPSPPKPLNWALGQTPIRACVSDTPQEIPENHASKVNVERVSDTHLRAVAKARQLRYKNPLLA